jgi:hypothetical protein
MIPTAEKFRVTDNADHPREMLFWELLLNDEAWTIRQTTANQHREQE